MSPKLKAAIVHVLVVAIAVAGTVSVAAATLSGLSVAARYVAVITAVATVVSVVAHQLLGYFGPDQPPTTGKAPGP